MVRFSGAKDENGKRVTPQALYESVLNFENLMRARGMKWDKIGFASDGRAVNATVQLLENKPHLMAAQFSGFAVQKTQDGKLFYIRSPYSDYVERIKKMRFPQVEDWVKFNDAVNHYFDAMGWSLTILSKTHKIRAGKDGNWRPRWIEFLSGLDASLYRYGRALDQGLYMV